MKVIFIYIKRDDYMKLKFIGAAHEVTGSCTLLEACAILLTHA